MRRRTFLIRYLLLALGSCLGNLFGVRDSHADRAADDFADQPFTGIVTRLFGARYITDSDQLSIDLPNTAENGAVVPITISSDLDGIDRVYVLVEKNPTPLAADFQLSSSSLPYISARIKMAESANVVVIAKQGERLLKAQRWVNVVQGGCGTG